jgi:hypothetical protein
MRQRVGATSAAGKRGIRENGWSLSVPHGKTTPFAVRADRRPQISGTHLAVKKRVALAGKVRKLGLMLLRRDFIKAGALAVGGVLVSAQTAKAQEGGGFTLPDLAYPLDALEPHIDATTMGIHHSKHHLAYITNLNTAVASSADLKGKTIEALLGDLHAIKDAKLMLLGAVSSPSDFKGGGYDKAREAFSAVALAFGVIAAYDQEIRWKKDAETARDLFARVGSNCKVGTEQSFNESKLRVADLESLLDGIAPTARADREDDFRWSQTAGRPATVTANMKS